MKHLPVGRLTSAAPARTHAAAGLRGVSRRNNAVRVAAWRADSVSVFWALGAARRRAGQWAAFASPAFHGEYTRRKRRIRPVHATREVNSARSKACSCDERGSGC